MASLEKMHKVDVIAPLTLESAALSEVAKILDFPPEADRQPDLQYLTAIFVSSGMNRNGAVFLGSELIKARSSIRSKAVDIEHDEQSIIGQITGSAFLNRDRSPFDAETSSRTKTTEQQDELEMDIAISAIIHKARFPEISSEIQDGMWMVSMEAYYRDYDVKVGDLVIPREQAEVMGFDKHVGSVVQVKDGDKELGFHLVGRVLRDILFAGVGIVKDPANPRSIIMEAAAVNDYVEEKKNEGEVPTINVADISAFTKTEVEVAGELSEETSNFIRQAVLDAVSKALEAGSDEPSGADLLVVPVDGVELSGNLNHILPGTCVSFKKSVFVTPPDSLDEPATDLSQYPLSPQEGDSGLPRPGDELARENWCSLFDLECSARPGDATLPTCWRNVFARTVREEITNHEDILRQRRIQQGLVSLQSLIDGAKKFM